MKRRGPWKSREAVEVATLEWVNWSNHHRLLEPIGHLTSAEAEANYYRNLALMPLAARLKSISLCETRGGSN